MAPTVAPYAKCETVVSASDCASSARNFIKLARSNRIVISFGGSRLSVRGKSLCPASMTALIGAVATSPAAAPIRTDLPSSRRTSMTHVCCENGATNCSCVLEAKKFQTHDATDNQRKADDPRQIARLV